MFIEINADVFVNTDRLFAIELRFKDFGDEDEFFYEFLSGAVTMGVEEACTMAVLSPIFRSKKEAQDWLSHILEMIESKEEQQRRRG